MNMLKSFECPLTGEIMKEPVMAMDNYSYESEAIKEWFKNNNISPVTGEKLSSTSLIPNKNLKGAIIWFQNQEKLKPSISNGNEP